MNLLSSFVSRFYKSLDDNFDVLTPKAKRILPIMKEQNWLESYATIEGIT